MILDTSAIIAVLANEPDAPDLAQRMEAAQVVRVSAATVLEASLVAGPTRQHDLDDLLAAAAANIVPVDDSSCVGTSSSSSSNSSSSSSCASE